MIHQLKAQFLGHPALELFDILVAKFDHAAGLHIDQMIVMIFRRLFVTGATVQFSSTSGGISVVSGTTDANGAATERRVWPLALAYWGARWTLGAWCELRGDFRNFGLERIQELQVLEQYPDQEGRRLADLLRHLNAKR